MSIEANKTLDELIRMNENLKIKLKVAEAEVSSLRLEINKLNNVQLELFEKLKDSDNEIERLLQVVKHQVKDRETITRLCRVH